MPDIKRPDWDKLTWPMVRGTWDNNMPPRDYIAVGMTAYAKLKDISVEMSIKKVLENNEIEGEVINFHSGSKIMSEEQFAKITGLSVGEIVYVKHGYFNLNQDINSRRT